MQVRERYDDASLKTASDLRSVVRSSVIRELSRLSLPELDAAVDMVGRLVPAGNVPGMILNGLARLAGRRPPLETVHRDIRLLFQGVEQLLDRAVYGTFFAGPAAVIWGYQHLLKLAGINPTDSFPEGTWQFYVEYALREDTARHTNETHGFDSLLKQHQLELSPVDRVTAWVMTAIHCLHQYDQLLENEWRERVYIHLLKETTPDSRYTRLYRDWLRQRPYGRGPDCPPDKTYPVYRRELYDRFLRQATTDIHDDRQRKWRHHIRTTEAQDLPSYQRQMSILAYLDPGTYGETRVPIPLKKAHVGLVHHGHYYVIPVCLRDSEQPTQVTTVRTQIATLMAQRPEQPPTHLEPLARIRRAAWTELHQQLGRPLRSDLDTLRLAPILLNNDPCPRHLPLSDLRQAERGIGDHALSIFDTGTSFVFDQSHIFFDGVWGVALSEILTNQALSWAVYLHTLPPAQADGTRPHMLHLVLQPYEQALIQQAPRSAPEAGAESEAVKLKAILSLRKAFKQRNDLIELTVNDLLVLYRAIHAITYQPAPNLLMVIESLAGEEATHQAASAALKAIEPPRAVNPAILIPIDASQHSPRERLYPMSFEVPLNDLDLIERHRQTIAALEAYERADGDRTATYAEFDQLQRSYLATLAGFGFLLSKAKEIAMVGESVSVGAIRLLAHLPPPLQQLLDKIPSRFDVLNDIIKGREVFSNVGAVAPSSTLRRFITAKDDNEKKTLAWGVLTDAEGQMRITLRDFRPHIGLLQAAGRRDIAIRITQDYVDSYAHGLNQFVRDLQRITLASRQTRGAVADLG